MPPHFSAFHDFVFARFPPVIDGKNDNRELCLAPRGEAKSIYETQLGSLWCIVAARKRMIRIIMSAEEQAVEMLGSVKAELDANPRLRMDFLEACGEGRVWKLTTIVAANDVELCIGGTGKKIRDMKHGPCHPGLVFLDSLENDDNVRDETPCDKVEQYVLSIAPGFAERSGGMDVFRTRPLSNLRWIRGHPSFQFLSFSSDF
ncbi:MAG: hypothetical protein LBD67_09320 [Candidatus Accumulibacter sp.]|jgi:hypothetical protein|nr:hypothetical protein [Accumulibacter sp.]